MKNLKMPKEELLFKLAVERVQKNLHFIFLVSDMMTYKECFSIFRQFEYHCEIMFLHDLNSNDYFTMADSFLQRSNITEDLLGDDGQLAKSLVEIRNRVKALLLKTFYSPNMLKNTIREDSVWRGAAEFIFNDTEQITGNIFGSQRGYRVVDPYLKQTLLNMPLEVFTVNKHRFAMLLEVFRFLYDLLSMHLSIRKAYYETFLAKVR